MVDLSFSENLHDQVLAQRIDHRRPDAVQPAGNLVGIVVELSAGVQAAHDHFQRGDFQRRVRPDGYADAVVLQLDL